MKYLNRKTLAELCNEAGITCTTYYYRRRKGKTHEEALESKKPIRTVEDIARQQRRRQRLARGVPEELVDLPKNELFELGYLKNGTKIFLHGEPLKDFCKKRGLKYNSVYVFIKRHGIEKAEEKYGNDYNDKRGDAFSTL